MVSMVALYIQKKKTDNDHYSNSQCGSLRHKGHTCMAESVPADLEQTTLARLVVVVWQSQEGVAKACNR